MKNVTIAILCALTLASCGSSRATEALQRLVNTMPDKRVTTDDSRKEDDVLIIFYDPSVIKEEELLKQVKAYSAEVMYAYKNFNGIAIKLAEGTTLGNAISHFSSTKGILSVTRSEEMRLMD